MTKEVHPCKYCNAAYAQRESLIRHTKQNHQEEDALALKNKGGRQPGQTIRSGKLTVYKTVMLKSAQKDPRTGETQIVERKFQQINHMHMDVTFQGSMGSPLNPFYQDHKGKSPNKVFTHCVKKKTMSPLVQPIKMIDRGVVNSDQNFTNSDKVKWGTQLLDASVNQAVNDRLNDVQANEYVWAGLGFVRRTERNLLYDFNNDADSSLQVSEPPQTGSHIRAQPPRQESSVFHSSQANVISESINLTNRQVGNDAAYSSTSFVDNTSFVEKYGFSPASPEPSAHNVNFATPSELDFAIPVFVQKLSGKKLDRNNPSTIAKLKQSLAKNMNQKRYQ